MPSIAARALSFVRDPGGVALGDSSLFADIAADAPVIRAGRTWILGSHSIIREALTSRALRIPSLDGLGESESARIARTLLPVQPTDTHRRIRGVLGPAFSRRGLDDFRSTIDSVVDDLFTEELADLDAHGAEIEIIEGIGRRLPLFSLCALLGVPRDDWDHLLHCARHINQAIVAQIHGVDHPSSASLASVHRYVDGRLDEPEGIMAHPAILEAHESGELSRAELTAITLTLFTGGIDTVGGAIANTLLALSTRPDIRAGLTADPTLAIDVFREASRLHTPLPMIGRTVTEATTLADGEVSLAVGDTVLILFAAGNLDPRAIDDPTEFRLGRDHRSDLTYGRGPHYCLGSNIADAEGASMLAHLVRHCPDWRIARPDELTRAEGRAFNSPRELHLAIA